MPSADDELRWLKGVLETPTDKVGGQKFLEALLGVLGCCVSRKIDSGAT